MSNKEYCKKDNRQRKGKVMNKEKDNSVEDMINILNQLYLYAKVCHDRPADYKEVIDGLRNKYPKLAKRITGVL